MSEMNGSPRIRSSLSVAAALMVGLVLCLPAVAGAATRTGRPFPTLHAGATQNTTTTTAPAPTAPAAAGTGRGGTTCTPTALTNLKNLAGVQLSDRVGQLGTLTQEVDANADLTPSDRSTLSSLLGNELPGIQTLQTQVSAATTCGAVLADAKAMVDNFRVYVVMTPQVHLTIAADTETTIAGQLANLEPVIQGAITAAQNAGHNVATAQAAFSDLETQVTTAQNDAGPIPAQVLGFTPQSYPGCWGSFQADQDALQSGRAALRGAAKDLQTIIASLG
jgi:hypothetical protein